MKMVTKDEKEHLKSIIADTVTLLCKNRLHSKFHREFIVEGLIGITVDSNDLLIVPIRDVVMSTDNCLSSDATDDEGVSTHSQTVYPRRRKRKHGGGEGGIRNKNARVDFSSASGSDLLSSVMNEVLKEDSGLGVMPQTTSHQMTDLYSITQSDTTTDDDPIQQVELIPGSGVYIKKATYNQLQFIDKGSKLVRKLVREIFPDVHLLASSSGGKGEVGLDKHKVEIIKEFAWRMFNYPYIEAQSDIRSVVRYVKSRSHVTRSSQVIMTPSQIVSGQTYPSPSIHPPSLAGLPPVSSLGLPAPTPFSIPPFPSMLSTLDQGFVGPAVFPVRKPKRKSWTGSSGGSSPQVLSSPHGASPGQSQGVYHGASPSIAGSSPQCMLESSPIMLPPNSPALIPGNSPQLVSGNPSSVNSNSSGAIGDSPGRYPSSTTNSYPIDPPGGHETRTTNNSSNPVGESLGGVPTNAANNSSNVRGESPRGFPNREFPATVSNNYTPSNTIGNSGTVPDTSVPSTQANSASGAQAVTMATSTCSTGTGHAHTTPHSSQQKLEDGRRKDVQEISEVIARGRKDLEEDVVE